MLRIYIICSSKVIALMGHSWLAFLFVSDIHVLAFGSTAILIPAILLVAQVDHVILGWVDDLLIFTRAEVVRDESHIVGGSCFELVRLHLVISVGSSNMNSSWSRGCLVLLNSSYTR